LCKREGQGQAEMSPDPHAPAERGTASAGAPVIAVAPSPISDGPHWLMSALGVFGLVLAAAFVLYLRDGGEALAFLDTTATPVAAQTGARAPTPAAGVPPRALREQPHAQALHEQPARPPLREPRPRLEAPPAHTPDQIAAEQEQDRRRAAMLEADRRQSAMAHQRRNVSVMMYSTSWCPACKMAREYMTSKGIAFVDHDVDESESAHDELVRLNPRGSIPTIDVEGDVMVGFSAEHFEDMLDRAARRRAGI
jgi:glutaredoxin